MKRILIFLAAFFAFGALCFIGIFASDSILPPHDDLQVNRLQTLTGERSTLTLTADTDEGSYIISRSAELTDSFAFDTWKACKKQRGAEALYTLRIGTQITLTFSSDGYVAAHHASSYGGRGRTVSRNAYYTISPTAVSNLLSYIQEHGIPQT